MLRGLWYGWEQKTRKILTEKIAQLNSAIDDVSSQLRANDVSNGAALVSDEVETAIWWISWLVVYFQNWDMQTACICAHTIYVHHQSKWLCIPCFKGCPVTIWMEQLLHFHADCEFLKMCSYFTIIRAYGLVCPPFLLFSPIGSMTWNPQSHTCLCYRSNL